MNKIVVIGASTGGPGALEELLPQFTKDFPYPICIVQHLPSQFTKTFAERINKKCALDFIEAYDGLVITGGTIYLAPGGTNMELSQSTNGMILIKIVTATTEHETPSIDQLMISAANIYHQNTIGVILTGMGKDGLEGMRAIKLAGGKTIVQDEASSIVYGMGKEIVDSKLADHVVPLKNIIREIYG